MPGTLVAEGVVGSEACEVPRPEVGQALLAPRVSGAYDSGGVRAGRPVVGWLTWRSGKEGGASPRFPRRTCPTVNVAVLWLAGLVGCLVRPVRADLPFSYRGWRRGLARFCVRERNASLQCRRAGWLLALLLPGLI